MDDAFACAEKHVRDEPFAVLGDSRTNGSIPCTKQLIDVFIINMENPQCHYNQF